MRRKLPAILPLNVPSEVSYVGEDDSEYFTEVHGRRVNSMNTRYMLPADADEIRRSELHHRMLQFLFAGKNYVGPVKEILTFDGGPRKPKVLDLGTGGGHWAIDIADEFSHSEVIGVDLAPIQPRKVPLNCTFELCDLDQWHLPYPNEYFDVIHARSMHTGIKNYPRLLVEIARMLRPGGLVILIEPDTEPMVDGKFASQIARSGHESGMPGWVTLWREYRRCLKTKGIDLLAPGRLRKLLQATNAFRKVVSQQADIPIGFWPKDDLNLTIGQLAWLDYDLLLPAMRPLLLSSGKQESEVKALVENAHHDLYYPIVNPSTRLHVVHALKRS